MLLCMNWVNLIMKKANCIYLFLLLYRVLSSLRSIVIRTGLFGLDSSSTSIGMSGMRILSVVW